MNSFCFSQLNYSITDVVGYFDYLPFGQVMPNRHNQQSYEYGYNGMRIDEELKGEFNSYDFGARILDPRIGRWLCRDKESAKKPGLSPYQSMKNNPLVYIDPNGNDEFQVIKVVDENGKELKRIAYKISDAYISSGIIKQPDFGYKYSNGFDFKRVITITVSNTNDREIKNVTNELMTIYSNGIKDVEYLSPKKEGKIYTTDFELSGGLYMTSSDAQGKAKRYSESDPQYVGNIDKLLEFADLINKKLPKSGKPGDMDEFIKDELDGKKEDIFIELLKVGLEVKIKTTNVNEIIDVLVNSTKPKAGCQPKSNEGGSKCIPDENGKGCFHQDADPSDPDTLGGKNPNGKINKCINEIKK
jgi:RHS repeat-associated protein